METDDEMPIDQRLQRIEVVVGKFAEAILVNAQHLASHTSAVINLAEAAQDLKRAAAEQNKVLSEFAKVLEEIECPYMRR